MNSWPPGLLYVPKTGSTNTDVRRMAREGFRHGTALMADEQTEGRGRLGRTWISPPGDNLYVSILLRPATTLDRLPLLVLGAAVAVAECCGPDYRLKWPNDVRRNGAKVAGILAEVEPDPTLALIVGIGVNVRSKPDLPGVACLDDDGVRHDRDDLASEVVTAVLRRAAEAVADPSLTLAAWRARSDTLGQRVRIGAVEGLAVDIDRDGALLVRKDDGQLDRVVAGDVEMVG